MVRGYWKKVPKKGDGNCTYLRRIPKTLCEIERKSPRKGTETILICVCPHVDTVKLKESPQERGRKRNSVFQEIQGLRDWKKVPKKGDGNTPWLGSHTHDVQIERKSPRKGTETRWWLLYYMREIPIERKSPRKGTETIGIQYSVFKEHYWKKVPKKGDGNS